MRFDNRPWAVQLYVDNSDKIVIVKSSKTGVSEWALCDVFCLAQHGISGMYVLPDRKIKNRFISTRLDSIIGRVEEYRKNIMTKRKSVDSKDLKSIYDADWSFEGSGGSHTQFYEFNAGCMIYDEYDKCDQVGIAYGEDRTLGATRVMWRKIGNPTVSGYGIALEYESTDKKQWFTKCDHCGKWDNFDWFTHFVRETDNNKFLLLGKIGSSNDGRDSFPVCRYCSKPRNRLAPGEWVAEHPDIDISGYQIGRLFGFPGNDDPNHVRQIVNETFETFEKAQGNPTLTQRFYNNILGQTYTGTGAKFSDDLLKGCVADYIMPVSARNTYAGVDVGGKLHLHIEKIVSGKRKKLFIGAVPNWNELHTVCKRFGVNGGVIDAEPEHHKALEFVQAHPGWFVCYYNLSDTDAEEFKIDYVTQTIRTKRTASLDTSMQSYADGSVLLPRDYKTVDDGDFVKMMCESTRVELTAPNGTIKFIWTKGKDHHQHTDNYARLASENCQGGGLITVI